MQEALALGDITVVEDHVSLLLSDFQISLDRKSASYRELATLALQAYVRALQAIGKRNAGEPGRDAQADPGRPECFGCGWERYVTLLKAGIKNGAAPPAQFTSTSEP